MKGLEKLKSQWVEFLGRLPDEELYRYYGQCKAFLALATDEDFGLTPVEAMAAGRPVIAFRGGGYLESVIEGKTGVFFDRPTSTSLARVLKDFDPQKFNSLGVKLAKRGKVPVIPIALKTDVWGIGRKFKDFGKIRPAIPAHITFGDPLQVQGSGKEEHKFIVDFITRKLDAYMEKGDIVD